MKMEGYIFDTNAVSDWINGHPILAPRINALDAEAQVRVSAITLGEFEFGNNLILSNRDLTEIDDFERFIARVFIEDRVLAVTRTTRYVYGPLRARIFEKYPPIGKKQNHVEKCFDKITGSDLGIDENDLWIASQAIERGLTLITNDKMEYIKGAAEDLGNAMREIGWQLKVEDWTK
jgi:predicted nucleic acid-binding protein